MLFVKGSYRTNKNQQCQRFQNAKRAYEKHSANIIQASLQKNNSESQLIKEKGMKMEKFLFGSDFLFFCYCYNYFNLIYISKYFMKICFIFTFFLSK